MKCAACKSRKTLGGAYDMKCVVCCASYLNLAAKDGNIVKRHYCLLSTTPDIPSIESIFDELEKRVNKERFDFIKRHANEGTL